jgi:outer membrane lipoprotein-sorting protein
VKIRLIAVTVFSALSLAAAAADDAANAMKQVEELTSKVNGYTADMEVRNAEPDGEQVARSRIAVSKEHGWKMEDNTTSVGGHVIVNDYKTSYEYIPEAKTVYKFTADHPQIAEDFRRPAEMNIVATLDPKTVKLVGKEQVAGETLYRFEGTTSTQFMPRGKPVVRRIEAWVSAQDGLARKTIEYTEETTGVTMYSNVRINPAFKPDDFLYTPPAGVRVLDINAEMRKQAQGQGAPTQPQGQPRQ